MIGASLSEPHTSVTALRMLYLSMLLDPPPEGPTVQWLAVLKALRRISCQSKMLVRFACNWITEMVGKRGV